MPFQVGSIALHDDGQHLGSAKRDAVDGVAGLGPGGNVLAVGSDIELTRDGSDNIEIVERTSGNIVFRWTRVGVNDFECRVNCGGVACIMQNDSMKDVINGIAALDAGGDILAPGSELSLTRDGADSIEIRERTSNEVAFWIVRFAANQYEIYGNEGGVPVRVLMSTMKNAALGIAGLDASAVMSLAQIPNTLTGKDADTLDGSHGGAYMKRAPDYDSGCFSIAGSSFVVKTHNLNTRTLLVKTLYGDTDTDCVNDGTSGAGKPVYTMWDSANRLALYSASVDTIEMYNINAATRYFRILVWKGE